MSSRSKLLKILSSANNKPSKLQNNETLFKKIIQIHSTSKYDEKSHNDSIELLQNGDTQSPKINTESTQISYCPYNSLPLEGVEINLPDLSQTNVYDNANKDMAILFAFFNPAKSKRILMNYLLVNNYYRNQGLPTYTIELVFNDEKPEITDATVHVRSKSYMFYKEHLLRILEKKIPEKYTKLAFLDADVIFDNINWYIDASEMLNNFDVIQPFEKCIWLDITYTKALLLRLTWLKQPSKEVISWLYHPGFAWCMRRDYYRDVGFFDMAFATGGDTMSSVFWLQMNKGVRKFPRLLQKQYDLYFEKRPPKISYLTNITVYHLYHGSRVNRKYYELQKLLDIPLDIEDIIFINENGIFEWKDNTLNTTIKEYFFSREDDGI